MRMQSIREFDLQNKMRQAQVFIKAKQFDEAEDLLEEIATPDANRLLLRLQKYRLAVEINKPRLQVQQQSNIKAPSMTTPKRYPQLRMLSYFMRGIAFGWACVGFATFWGWSMASVMIIGMIAQIIESHEAAFIILIQAFFIYVFGVAVGTLADIAENLAINTALLSDENSNS